MTEIFKGRNLLIVTKHKKETALAPIFEKHLGVKCITIENFDTDQFGTFTNEIRRNGNQLEAARRKLMAGLKHSHADLGVSSEGSFHPHPSFPWMTRNLELCLLIDLKNNIEAKGHSQNIDGISSIHEIQDTSSTLGLIKKWGFPHQGVIIRKKRKLLKDKIYKDFCDPSEIHKVIKNNEGSILTIEPDFRAHLNPKRMEAIKDAGLDLITILTRPCQSCKYLPLEYESPAENIRCIQCNTPSKRFGKETWSCPKCKTLHLFERKDKKRMIKASECEFCNP